MDVSFLLLEKYARWWWWCIYGIYTICVCVARDVVVVVWFGLTLYVIFKSKGRLCNVSSLVK